MTETKKPLTERIAEYEQYRRSGEYQTVTGGDVLAVDLIAAYNAMLAADTSASDRAAKLEAENAHLRSRLKPGGPPVTITPAEIDELERTHASEKFPFKRFCKLAYDDEEAAMRFARMFNAMPALLAAARRVHDLERENAHLRSRLKNSTMPLTNEQQLIDALERVKEAEAILREVAARHGVPETLSAKAKVWLHTTIEQAETTE